MIKKDPYTPKDHKTFQNAGRELGARETNAVNEFVDDVMEQFGFTREDAIKILDVYRHKKVRAVKMDWGIGRYNLTHGAFWEKSPMEKALEMYNTIIGGTK